MKLLPGLVEESVLPCATCQASTPHSRRTLAWTLLFAPAAAWAMIHHRELPWRLGCERCRGKARIALARTRPTQDGTTTIDVI